MNVLDDRLVDVRLGDLAERLDLRQFEAGVLKPAQRLAERLTVPDVVDRQRQRSPHDRRGCNAGAEPLLGQIAHQVAEALIDFAEQVGGRHPDVTEEQLRRVLRALADLVEVTAAFEARRSGLDDDEADAFVAYRRSSDWTT